MKFEMVHRFECSAEALWELIEDAEYEAKLAAASGAGREVLWRREEGEESVVRRKITAKRTLPAPMAKLVGGEEISYEQETRRVKGAEVMRWRIITHVLSDRFRGEGTTLIRDVAGGCERVISGELVVSVPLMGGKMEAKLVEDVRRGYDEGARILKELWAARRGV